MPTLLTLDTTRSSDGRLVLTATGEIDLSNVEAFSEALALAVAETDSGSGTLTVDLSGVEYLDSAAVNALFSHVDQIRVIAHPQLARVFDISGFTELTTVESGPLQAEN